MKRLISLGSLSLAAVVMLGSGCAMDEQIGMEEQASHAWGNYHWARTSNPFTVKLGDNVTSAWDAYLADADQDWSQSTVLNTVIVPGTAGSPKRCSATTGQVEVCNDAYGNNGWLGIAGIYASGDHITKAYVKLNDTYYASATYNTPEWRRLVMCQEVGHTFGLAHQDENFNNTNLKTCMDYTNNPSTNQHPNSHDYQMLQDIYSHLDSTTTVSSTMPTEMANADFSSPETWGELVDSDEDGHQQTYVRNFGTDHKVITHVFWAPL